MPLDNELFAQVRTWLAAKTGQVLLICGAAGSGKTALASEAARYILCEEADATVACGHCAACRYFMAHNHPDYFVLAPQAGERNIKVAALREHLLSDTVLQPQIGRYKVYQIAADYLNEQGQNALLKTLEEPPPYAYFILTVAAEEKLLPTVRSRVVPLRIRPLTATELQAQLQAQGYTLELSQAAMLSALCGGAPGQAVALLESPWFMELRAELCRQLQKWPLAPRHLLLSENFEFFNAEKEHYAEMLQILHSLLRDLLALRRGATHERLLNQDYAATLQAFSEKGYYDEDALLALIAEVGQMSHGRQVNENFEMAVCHLLLCFEKFRLPAILKA